MKLLKAMLITAVIFIAVCAGGAIVKSDGFKEFVAYLKSSTGYTEEEITEIKVEEFYVFSPRFNSCYNCLTAKQKEIYELLYSAAEQMPDGFIRVCAEYGQAKRDIHVAYNAMLYDNAEIFWMPGSYLLGNKGGYITIAFNYSGVKEQVSYNVNRQERASMRDRLEKKVDEILNGLTDKSDDYTCEKYFNDYICDHTEYSVSAELSNTAYGCLVSGKALCEGYSRAFKLLCNKAEIECDLVSGVSHGENHMWNVVNTDGIHAYVDITWNDSEPALRYMYFNITDSQLLYDHTLSPLLSEISDSDIANGAAYNFTKKQCTYSGNSYYAKNGLLIYEDYAYKIPRLIGESRKKGDKYITLMTDSASITEKLKSNADAVLTEIQLSASETAITQYIYERDLLVLFFD